MFDKISDKVTVYEASNQVIAEGNAAPNRTWLPPVDIRESENELTLSLDLPGLRKEDVNITLENSVLTNDDLGPDSLQYGTLTLQGQRIWQDAYSDFLAGSG